MDVSFEYFLGSGNVCGHLLKKPTFILSMSLSLVPFLTGRSQEVHNL
jgi:hypothetical protein